MARRLRLSDCTVDLHNGEVSGERSGRLTTRELLLLEQLLADEGQPVAREVLLAAFGYAPSTRSRAVDKTMWSLRAKVEPDPSTPVHLVTVFGHGYALHCSVEEPLPPARERLAPRNRLVGRQRELTHLATMLRQPGLITLVGPGGVGKTRLAWHLADADPNLVGVVELATATDARDLTSAVGEALGAHRDRIDDPAEIGHLLAARDEPLLVLDNLEHLVEHAPLVARWSTNAPKARILATSRQPLQLCDERVLRLAPLEPDAAEELLRARATEAGHPLVDGAALGPLAERLDRLPFALELAAAHLDVYAPEELGRRLPTALLSLSSPVRDQPARFRDLDAMLEWSWRRLPARARTLLTELSVFEGPFSLAATEGVSTLPAGEVGEALAVLVRRSLVQRRARPDYTRFGLLEVVGHFARARLGPELRREAELRHATWFAAARPWREPDGRSQLDDLRAAFARSLAHGRFDLAAPLLWRIWRIVSTRGPLELVDQLVDQAGAIDDLPPEVDAEVAIVRGSLLLGRQDLERARAELGRARALARRVSATPLEARAWCRLGTASRSLGDPTTALACFEGVASLYGRLRALRTPADPFEEAFLLGERALTNSDLGNIADARRDLEAALAIHRREGHREMLAATLSNLASNHHQAGRTAASRACLEQALALAREQGQGRTEAMALGNLGLLLMELGELEAAETHLVQSVARHRELGNPAQRASTLGHLGLVESRRGRVDDAVAHLEEAAELHRQRGARLLECDAVACLGAVYATAGRYRAARASLEQGLALARDIGHRFREGTVLSNLAAVTWQEGDRRRAFELIDEALSVHRELGRTRSVCIAHLTRAEFHLEAGDRASAGQDAESALALARSARSTNLAVQAELVLAALDARRGSCAEARARLDRVERDLEGLNDPELEARWWVRTAEVALAEGSPDDASCALDRAEAAMPNRDAPPRGEIDELWARIRGVGPGLVEDIGPTIDLQARAAGWSGGGSSRR